MSLPLFAHIQRRKLKAQSRWGVRRISRRRSRADRGQVLRLRPLQKPIFGLIRAEWKKGATNVLVQAPCGFGKTEVATAILKAVRAKFNRGAFICDRISLVRQTSQRFDKYGLPHSVVQASHWRFDPRERIQLCSIQTLTRRSTFPDTDLLIIDEAHVLPAAIKRVLRERKVRTIGLTATPFTKGLGKYFDAVVNAATTRQLIREGWLSPYRIFSCREANMEGVPVKADGEFDPDEAASRAIPIVGDCVAEYIKHGYGKKFIAFAHSVAHAEELQRQFSAAGIPTALYTYQQTDREKELSVEEFRKPMGEALYWGMISIEALTRGFDVADIEVMVIARKLNKALAVHIQMLGRALRVAEGKKEALILDHSGNCAHFWGRTEDFFDHGVRELDDGKRREAKKQEPKEKESKKCPKCACLHPARPTCPNCGYAYPRRSKVVQIAGELRELTGFAKPNGSVKQELYSQLLHIAHEQGREPKWANAFYRERTGEWPVNLAMTSSAPSQRLRDWVLGQQIRYAKGMKKRRSA